MSDERILFGVRRPTGAGWATGAVLAGACLLAVGCASTPGSAKAPSPQKQAAGAESAANQTRRARMHYDVGVEHLRAGRTAEGLGELLSAVRYDPGDKWVRLATAEAYRRKDRLPEAEGHLKAALQIDPDFQTAHLNLAAIYIQMERFEESLPHTKRLVDDPTYPRVWRAHTNLGWAQFKLGEISEARENLETALDYRDAYWPARLDVGILEAEQGNKLVALDHFERVLEVNPGPLPEAEVHYRMAEVFVSLGQREQAVRHLGESMDRRPNGPWGDRSEEYLKLLQ